MSDLDDFFAKRLDEEATFPNRAKNWKQMSKRLDAFDAGAVQAPRSGLRLWQAATGIAVVAAGFILWKTLNTERENKVLRQEVALLQNRQSKMDDKGTNKAINTTEFARPSLPNFNPEIPANPTIQPSPKPSISKNSEKTGLLPTEKNAKEAAHLVAVPEEKLLNLEQQNMSDKTLFFTGLELKTPELKDHVLPITIAEKSDSSALHNSEIALLSSQKDSLSIAQASKDSLLVVMEMPQDSLATVPILAQNTKPVRALQKRLRIGAQATLGFAQPKQAGVSVIRGQGFTAEAKIMPSFWLSASAEWLHHEVATKELVKKFHPPRDSFPKPPVGGGPQPPPPPKLVLVESTPRYLLLGLGFRYELPVRFWLRPSIRIAHEWKRIAPTLVTYKFEKAPIGPSPNHEFTAEKFDAQWLSNQWRLGFGLEKEIPNWTFGLWADYSKVLSEARPAFDALYLRAGAQFRF